MEAYKAFDQNLQCLGFQFEVGESFELDGKVSVCKSGFHACENPLDVWNYYPLDSRYAVVELGGETSRHGDDSKVAAGRITISAEITLPQLINDGVAYLMGLCDSTASGDCSQLAASGDYSQLAASGNYSQLAVSGENGKIAASGENCKLAASGNYTQIAASGKYSQLAASSNGSTLAASGSASKLAVSGKNCRLAASGNNSQLAASGENCKLAASGNGSKLAASGSYIKLTASGIGSKLATSGKYNQLAASGNDSVCMAASPGSTARAGAGGAIALTYHDGVRYRIAVAYVGEKGIKPNVDYYVTADGVFTEAKAW